MEYPKVSISDYQKGYATIDFGAVIPEIIQYQLASAGIEPHLYTMEDNVDTTCVFMKLADYEKHFPPVGYKKPFSPPIALGEGVKKAVRELTGLNEVSAVLQNVLPGMAAVKLTFSNITAEEAEKAKAKLEDSTWGSAKLFKVSDTEYAITASPYGLSLDVYHIDENTLYAAEYGKEVTTPKKLQEIGDRIEIDAAAHTLMDDLDIPNRDDVRSQRKFSNLYPHEQQAELDKIHSAAKLINTLKNNNRSR